MCGEISAAAAAATYFDDISRHHLQFGLLACSLDLDVYTHGIALYASSPISVTFQCVGRC